MLQYGIGALLIVLIMTITLSYYYNKEGFEDMTSAKKGTGAGEDKTAGASESKGADGSKPGVGVKAAENAELIKQDPNVNLIDKNAASRGNMPTNAQSILQYDSIVITTSSDKDYLYIYASAELLTNGAAMKYWLFTDNEADPENMDPSKKNPPIVLSKTVMVSNNPRSKSASIPLKVYAPYIGQTAYLVPEKAQTTDQAVATFIIPPPSDPTVINPRVSMSGTGYDAMKLNKHSNLLNDIQKIIHNEMLANRSLDVIVKNPRSRASTGSSVGTTAGATAGATAAAAGLGAAAGKGAAGSMAGTLSPKIQAKALAKMKNNSSDSSCGDSSYDSCGDSSCSSDSNPDMSKYIRKDQIPCYGCSLDY
jgi:hypothetical protein